MRSLIILFLILCYGSLTDQQNTSKINWLSWEELETALAERPKKTLIFFHADWCAYCKKIDRVVFTKPKIIAKLNADFYAVRMNVETTDSIQFDGRIFTNKQALTRRNGTHELPLLLASRPDKAFSLPVTILLEPNFKVHQRIFNYYTSSQLMDFLAF